MKLNHYLDMLDWITSAKTEDLPRIKERIKEHYAAPKQVVTRTVDILEEFSTDCVYDHSEWI